MPRKIDTVVVKELAAFLASNPEVTDKRMYDEIIEYNCHPDLVAVAVALGKNVVLETIELLKTCRGWKYDEALMKAAKEGSIEVMIVLKEVAEWYYKWTYDPAFEAAAKEGRLKSWGARDYNGALFSATLGGQVEVMKLLKEWGANKFGWDIRVEAGATLEAINLLTQWHREQLAKRLHRFNRTHRRRKLKLKALKANSGV